MFQYSTNNFFDLLRITVFLKDAFIDEIVIIGHSFMGVDEQYYRDILVPLYKDKKWIFYYYQSDELARIFIDKYGVKEYDFIEI